MIAWQMEFRKDFVINSTIWDWEYVTIRFCTNEKFQCMHRILVKKRYAFVFCIQIVAIADFNMDERRKKMTTNEMWTTPTYSQWPINFRAEKTSSLTHTWKKSNIYDLVFSHLESNVWLYVREFRIKWFMFA